MAKAGIYFDNAASTRVDPRVVAAMLPYFEEFYGNASSLHIFGEQAREALENSRQKLAALLGAKAEELVFTSGGTESNNFALKGIAYANRGQGRHLIVSQIEHDCILESCRWLAKEGFEITYLPVDGEGLIDLQSLANSIRKDTILVSIMHANNEIGTIEPIEEIGKICRDHQVYFHTDACQSFGKIPIDLKDIDLMTINSHKIYGPKGVGALFIREGVKIAPWQHGGGHEGGRRSSTENLPGIVGFVKAAELCLEEIEKERKRLAALRDRVIAQALANMETAYLNGPREKRLPNNVNLGFHGREADAVGLLLKLNDFGIAVSTGSACSSNRKSSHVLKAIGLNPIESLGALRITLGRFNTEEEVDYFLEVLPQALGSTRSVWSRGEKNG